MKKILALILFLPALLFGQEQTIETLDIFSRPDTVVCNNGGILDTISPIFFQVLKTSTENGTNYPNVRIDTILYQDGNCPADSAEVLRQLEVKAREINNKARRSMSNAFERVRRGEALFQDVRTLYNDFTGSDLYYRFEDIFWDGLEGVYAIVDVQNDTTVRADMIRIGGLERWRLEVQDGYLGAGERFTVLPRSNASFEVRQWSPVGGSPVNIMLFLDDGVEANRPVFRENGYLDDPDEDRLRLRKIE